MQSRQKTPVIVPNQGKSRQTLKMSKRLKWATSLSLWSAQTCLRFELGDMSPSSKAASCRRTPQRPRRHPLSEIRDPNPISPPIKAKNPAIVLNQGISRQTMKKPNATIMSANGAASYQPRATPWVCTPYVISPEGAAQLSNQGKNPCNQGKSCLIKASTKKT